MIVPDVYFDIYRDVRNAGSCGDLHGYVGEEREREPDDKPRRPIGFRMPERPLNDPSWLLL